MIFSDVGIGTDLTSIKWNLIAVPGGYAIKGLSKDGRRIYKLQHFENGGFKGYEPVYELIASRVADYLGIRHVQYHLDEATVRFRGRNYRNVLVSSCDNYHEASTRSISLKAYKEITGIGKNITSSLLKSHMQLDILLMFVYDFIIRNLDRNDTNIELIMRPFAGRYELAPLFSNGHSFSITRPNDVLALSDEWCLKDIAVNNTLGYMSLKDNLLYFCFNNIALERPCPLRTILGGIDNIIIPSELDAIYKVLEVRYNYAMEILHQGGRYCIR